MTAPARGRDGGTLALVFAKAPIAGEVKTRLAPALGEQGAAELHRRLLRTALRAALDADVGAVELWTTHDDAGREVLGGIDGADRIEVRMQYGEDLGARMAAALADGVERAPAVVLFGVDVPGIEADDLLAAHDALAAGRDAVLGPVEDGGYWLIGLSRAALDAAGRARALAGLFDAVPWSTRDVLHVTRARLAALSWRWHELPARWDVDRPEDLPRLAAHACGAALLAGLAPRR